MSDRQRRILEEFNRTGRKNDDESDSTPGEDSGTPGEDSGTPGEGSGKRRKASRRPGKPTEDPKRPGGIPPPRRSWPRISASAERFGR